MKKIIIVGAGRVGQQLARELSTQGLDLIMIERDKAVASLVSELYDVTVIQGNACDLPLLRKAAGDDTDMLIAVSQSDEINLTTTLLAGKLEIPTRVARIRNEGLFAEGGLDKDELGLDWVIYPEREAVSHLTKVIGINGAFDYAEFAGGEVALIGFDIAPGLTITGHSLAELREQFALDSFLIIGLYRENTFIVPHGEDRVMEGDKVWLLAAKETVPFVLPIFKSGTSAGERVVILGASRIGISVAEALKSMFEEVIIIESDDDLARVAAERLSDVKVLKSGGAETDLLHEIGIESINCFVAASADDKVNLMSALLAKRLGVARVAVITNETEYLPVMDAIGLDIVVNPLTLTAGAILRHIREGIVHSVVKLHAGEAELIEYVIGKDAPLAGKTLSEAGFPKGAVVGTVLKGDSTIIPDGSTVLDVGSKVVVVATSDKVAAIEKLFVSKRLFF